MLDVDLSPCLKLQRLRFVLDLTFVWSDKAAQVLRRLLRSWRPTNSRQHLSIEIQHAAYFTRQEFVVILGDMVGPVVDEWLGDNKRLSSVDWRINVRKIRRGVTVEIHDSEVWRDWWWTHIQERFPVCAKSGALEMVYETREQTIGTIRIAVPGLTLHCTFDRNICVLGVERQRCFTGRPDTPHSFCFLAAYVFTNSDSHSNSLITQRRS